MAVRLPQHTSSYWLQNNWQHYFWVSRRWSPNNRCSREATTGQRSPLQKGHSVSEACLLLNNTRLVLQCRHTVCYKGDSEASDVKWRYSELTACPSPVFIFFRLGENVTVKPQQSHTSITTSSAGSKPACSRAKRHKYTWQYTPPTERRASGVEALFSGLINERSPAHELAPS